MGEGARSFTTFESVNIVLNLSIVYLLIKYEHRFTKLETIVSMLVKRIKKRASDSGDVLADEEEGG